MGIQFRNNGTVKEIDSLPDVTHLEVTFVSRDRDSISGQIWSHDADGENMFVGTFSLDAEGKMFLYPDDEDGWPESSKLEIISSFNLSDITDLQLLRLAAEAF